MVEKKWEGMPDCECPSMFVCHLTLGGFGKSWSEEKKLAQDGCTLSLWLKSSVVVKFNENLLSVMSKTNPVNVIIKW